MGRAKSPRMRTIAVLLGVALLAVGCSRSPSGQQEQTPATQPDEQRETRTADSEQLRTWWHDNYELNTDGPVADDTVRRSSFYDVQVAPASTPDDAYDSFASMSIPRSGKDKVYDTEDGAEFSADAALTMSWSSVEYTDDVWVSVRLRTGQTVNSADQVTIRPSAYDFEKELVDP